MSIDIQFGTIAAQATPPGRGGVGVIRISGPLVKTIANKVLGQTPSPRQATFSSFLNDNDSPIDQGVALFFPSPNSFTGEDVLELQGHGGPVVMQMLLQRVVQLGARLARPGEFSERAFLNGKIDLTQAEAVADLIDSASEQAVRSSLRSLQGDFSRRIQQLLDSLINLRAYIEAAMDFPDEEIDFLEHGAVEERLNQLLFSVDEILKTAKQGALLREGLTIVIAGKPNVGKSSLLNQLSGSDTAIVTDEPGTTRDVIRERILINGVPLHVVDTAGLRESTDKVEQEGVRRAHDEIQKADHILLVVDQLDRQQTDLDGLLDPFLKRFSKNIPVTVIRNKIDLTGEKAKCVTQQEKNIVSLSAKTGEGIDLLKKQLVDCFEISDQIEDCFIARGRHLSALRKSKESIKKGIEHIRFYQASDLLAEELRQAQQALNEITGEFSNETLLDEIFSHFCVGK